MPGTPITLRRLSRFWLPLQATWLMMAVEGPFLAAVIARLPEPKYNLAAYGVAFAFAIIVEAPVIMMLSAATALVDARPGFLALRRFARVLNGLITAVMLVLLASPVMDWILLDLMRLDPHVADLTRRVAWGTVVRLITMAAVAIAATKAGAAGVQVGASALSAGVCSEALASRIMAHRTVHLLPDHPPAGSPRTDLTWRGLLTFYWPLALTSTISLAVQPVVTFFMGRARFPLESLAVLPVVNTLVFLFRTPGLSLQETAIAMLGASARNARPVLRFTAILAGGASIGLALVAWTPLARTWLVGVSGLTPELAAYAELPLRILTLMPALSVLLNLERALLVHGRTTGPVTTASVLEVSGIALALIACVVGLDMVGATAAAIAFMVGRVAANVSLLRPVRTALETSTPRI